MLFAVPHTAEPCVCLGEWPSLWQSMRKADVAVTGRVIGQGRMDVPRFYPAFDVAYIDVQIVKKLRGRERRPVVRVWDQGFGTDCSIDLRSYATGTFVGLALDRVQPEMQEYFDLIKIKPARTDYLVGACATMVESLESVDAAESYPKSPRKR